MTGMASRNTEPHQKLSRRIPPNTGPIALPAENAEIQTAIATDRCRMSLNMTKISDRVDGARVAPAIPRRARLRMSISGRVRERGQEGEDAERRGTDEEQLAPTDAVAERAHRDQEARDHEAVDVDDPEQLGARGLEVLADRGDGQMQDRQVHDVQQAGQGQDGEPDPLAAAGQRCVASGRHDSPS